MTKQLPTLGQRITVALQPETSITSADVAALMEEVEARIAKAEKECTIEQTLSLDPKAARQTIADATFALEQQRTLLSKLQARYQQAAEHEHVEEYEAEARRLDEESIRLAEELRARYRAAESNITDLFTHISAHRQRINALHGSRPAGVESVRDPELIARNLSGFAGERPSLLTEVHLVDWDSGRPTWPPPQPSMAAAFAATAIPGYERRFSGDWAEDNGRRAAGQRAEQQRLADFYARQTQQQEERENAEARERFDASQGKRWEATK